MCAAKNGGRNIMLRVVKTTKEIYVYVSNPALYPNRVVAGVYSAKVFEKNIIKNTDYTERGFVETLISILKFFLYFITTPCPDICVCPREYNAAAVLLRPPPPPPHARV